ncbi:hypothetical protein SIID45300_00164 [Candidatus Magnetaquicoccaceae bacterium FCR-1]|uniref:HTH tetR-type domain-containing protein n=1 Tax=Candidatus Magnetaquiglobus chichijimensis TaxID=3141448 RepID=A0ABQ0C4S1_9PROT
MTLPERPPAPRGRPRDPDRPRRILEAAAEQFCRLGYERTSMNAVAAASGISKVTIYRYFPTKQALFEAVVDQHIEAMFAAMPPGSLDPLHPEIALQHIAEQFVNLIELDSVLASFRLMMAAAGQQSNACQAFFDHGPLQLVHQVSAYMTAAAEAGTLAIHDPFLAANQFLALFHGLEHIQAQLDLGRCTPEANQTRIQANVALFLRACRPDG